MKISKLFIIVALLLATSIYAQDRDVDKDWYHSDFSTTKIYGVGDDAAREFLQSKGLKPTQIVVGVLDSGVEIDHPDLKANVWVNSDEIEGNGKDDDNNGYVDDINGWDFIGGPKGDVDFDTMESTRIVKKYKDVFEGENEKINAKNKKKMASEYAMYQKAKELFEKDSEEMQMTYMQLSEYKAIADTIRTYLPNVQDSQLLTSDFANTIKHDVIKQVFTSVALQTNGEMTFGDLMSEIDIPEEVYQYYEGRAKYNFNLDYDPRPIVGDDYSNVSEKYYGNNEVEGPDGSHGTHVSGIIAAQRDNNEGVQGIAGEVAKIMSVRTVPNGDERDKDVANAIIYAVDNGAKIINMSFGKPLSPNKDEVYAAMMYAQKKDVLLVHGSGNDNENIDEVIFYPTAFKDGKPYIQNFINVGASTIDPISLKANFSNYGIKQVDIYAPGQDIYSTYTNYTYQFADGTSMASPVVAGCAALLWAYFPKLSALQVKEILMESVNKSDVYAATGPQSENKKFNELCVSGGVVDVHKAVQLAYKKYPNAVNK